MNRVWAALALPLLLPASASYADTADIEHRCTVRYPSMMQYFAWKDCVKTETQAEAEADARREQENLRLVKEEAARPCIVSDITRMEGLASKAKVAIRSDSALEEAKSALSAVTGLSGQIQIADDNIRERVLISSIRTKCDSDFRLVINVREDSDKRLRWLRVGAFDAPAGYQSGVHAEFSADFEDERRRVEQRRFEEEYKAKLAMQDRDREAQRQNFLGSVKISDIKMDCGAAGSSCSFRTIAFTLTNVSQQPVTSIAYGWMFLSPQMTGCPAAIGTKKTEYMLVLQPGEKSRQSIFVTDAPEGRDARFCIRVTDLRTAN